MDGAFAPPYPLLAGTPAVRYPKPVNGGHLRPTRSSPNNIEHPPFVAVQHGPIDFSRAEVQTVQLDTDQWSNMCKYPTTVPWPTRTSTLFRSYSDPLLKSNVSSDNLPPNHQCYVDRFSGKYSINSHVTDNAHSDWDKTSTRTQEDKSGGVDSSLQDLDLTTNTLFGYERLEADIVEDEQRYSRAAAKDDYLVVEKSIYDERCSEISEETISPLLDSVEVGTNLNTPPPMLSTHPFNSRRPSLPSICYGVNSCIGSSLEPTILREMNDGYFPEVSSIPDIISLGCDQPFHSNKNKFGKQLNQEGNRRQLCPHSQAVRFEDSNQEASGKHVPVSPKLARYIPMSRFDTSSISPDSSIPPSPNRSDKDREVFNLDHVNTELTAWSWANKDELNSSPLRPQHPWLDEAHSIRESQHGSANGNVQTCRHLISPSSPPQATPSSTKNLRLSQKLPRSNAQNQRQAMEISDFVMQDAHFSSHRDSLILTHKRILLHDPGWSSKGDST